MEINELFETSDLSLCAALSVLGHHANKVEMVGKKSILFFEKTEEILKAVDQYFLHDLLVEPIAFFNAIREIKTRLYHA